MDKHLSGLGAPRGFAFGLLAGLTLVLTGCLQEGPAGDDGPAGPPGPPGVVLTGSPTAIKVAITSVAVTSGHPVVEFKVTDASDVAFAGLTASQARYTFAKLIPGANGDASRWQSYLNKTETPTVGPGTTPKTQAITDSGGTFVNHGDGTYTYTFGADVTTVTTPIAVTYDSAATHRLGMSVNIGNGVTPKNPVYDFVPLTGSTTLIAQREIVATASCNECHGKLAVHGGSRVDTKFCVTCHNPGSTDANSGNTVDMKVMIHKIHMGAELPSVEAGGGYFIYGFNNSLVDFSTVEFPQRITNCTKCHDPADAATPQAGNFASVPTMQAWSPATPTAPPATRKAASPARSRTTTST
jgi:OmcA/MtrC family decaheme c-type cytochrome